MLKSFWQYLNSLFVWVKRHHRLLLFILLFVLLLPNAITCMLAIPRIRTPQTAQARPVAIVFGAGLLPNGQPTPALEDRVSTAASLYRSGLVQSILMSGERNSSGYDEPAAMQTYAMSFGLPARAILLDGAGYRTYDTCYRARNTFNIRQAILVTTDYHLPRALFLCNALGIDSTGIATGWGASPRGPNYFLGILREIPATFTAFKEITFGPDQE
jgi:SanA protein